MSNVTGLTIESEKTRMGWSKKAGERSLEKVESVFEVQRLQKKKKMGKREEKIEGYEKESKKRNTSKKLGKNWKKQGHEKFLGRNKPVLEEKIEKGGQYWGNKMSWSFQQAAK